MEYRLTEPLSELSAKQWDFVTQETLSAREAVAFMRDGLRLRTFRDILRLIQGSDDCQKQLIDGLCELNPDAQPDSLRRKVSNWFSGKTLPGEREDVFQICFVLKLTLAQSEKALTLLTDHGIHYRDLHEMIYAYCLRWGLPYPYAEALAQQFCRKQDGGKSSEPVTQLIRQEFQSVRAEEDLFAFIARNRGNLGTENNTAYAYFCKMLALLTGEALDGEPTYSMEYVADEYLRLNIPKEKRTTGYSDVQKLVKKYWPSSRSIKAMKSRSEDVSRKTLLLLYLVTGGNWDQNYDELDESYIEPEEFLRTHCKRMNQMLVACGMRRIDPRYVFDYMLLYCLRPEEELFMSERMSALAAELFAE